MPDVSEGVRKEVGLMRQDFWGMVMVFTIIGLMLWIVAGRY